MKKQNMAVGFADLANFAKLVDTVGSEKSMSPLLLARFLLARLDTPRTLLRMKLYLGSEPLPMAFSRLARLWHNRPYRRR